MKTVNIREKLDVKKIEERLDKLKNFRELTAYKIALEEFYAKLYVILSELPFYEQYGIFDQCSRSAESILANLSEGTQSLYPKTAINFYSIALATANETQCWLDIMLVKKYFSSEDEYYQLNDLLEQVKKLIIYYIKDLIREIEL
ncbi:four helix bundle protein [Clostridium chromiireducens]|uniref:Four helix bundle protein n=1 Tax=Clostridium chromiireducens TaxID=225345 RepID=A0A964RMJ6_9CLOT|nr:four helix bundle protein [Clostridium chromiireducens]MVX64396.1 four helix bundle protein [Clostridium chromiireducens]